ncbi:MAG: ribonuclease P protein component [Rhodothermales bacterium]
MIEDSANDRSKPFQRLPRSFSLKRKSLITPLFDRRRDDVGTLTRGCLRIVYRVVPREQLAKGVPLQVGFAPGRIAGAVRRNRIKRLLREVYRVHQSDLVDLFSGRDDTLTMMIVYRGDGDDEEDLHKRIAADLPPLLSALHDREGETSTSAERRE